MRKRQAVQDFFSYSMREMKYQNYIISIFSAKLQYHVGQIL